MKWLGLDGSSGVRRYSAPYGTNDDDDADDDLYIIGAVCLSVCQQKSLFLYSKDLGVFSCL